uniref:Endonuclease/exonuclease/phosphatase domain-containing protein n=1 Tax=Neolamprologus brichardi TaxID=32507 RepID=A0A3Q4I3N5_NEOBR
MVKGMLHGETVLLGNIYAPNAQDDVFYTVLFSQLVDMDCANIILAGDFNCVLCPKMDKFPPQSTLTKNSKALWLDDGAVVLSYRNFIYVETHHYMQHGENL